MMGGQLVGFLLPEDIYPIFVKFGLLPGDSD